MPQSQVKIELIIKSLQFTTLELNCSGKPTTKNDQHLRLNYDCTISNFYIDQHYKTQQLVYIKGKLFGGNSSIPPTLLQITIQGTLILYTTMSTTLSTIYGKRMNQQVITKNTYGMGTNQEFANGDHQTHLQSTCKRRPFGARACAGGR